MPMKCFKTSIRVAVTMFVGNVSSDKKIQVFKKNVVFSTLISITNNHLTGEGCFVDIILFLSPTPHFEAVHLSLYLLHIICLS